MNSLETSIELAKVYSRIYPFMQKTRTQNRYTLSRAQATEIGEAVFEVWRKNNPRVENTKDEEVSVVSS